MTDIKTIKNDIDIVNKKNKLFWTTFLDVSKKIQTIKENQEEGEGEGEGVSSPVMKFITQIVQKHPEYDKYDLTMILLDFIYLNIKDEKDIYEMPEDKSKSKYEELCSIKGELYRLEQEYKGIKDKDKGK